MSAFVIFFGVTNTNRGYKNECKMKPQARRFVRYSSKPGTNPQSAIIRRSCSTVMPDVVSMSPEIAAFAPERKQAFPLSGISCLPPASRIVASGSKNRNRAIVRQISGYLSGGWF